MKEIITAPRNCWRQVKAKRAAFLVNGEAYFRALHESFRRAGGAFLSSGGIFTATCSWSVTVKAGAARRGLAPPAPEASDHLPLVAEVAI